MIKPTGRPRGRPKTKAYVTLMARMDVTLADRVKRYAAAHRQPLSVVIRDALALLMEEYPSGADPSGPHRLAAHEFLSDRYESPLDTLLGETDSAGLEALLSDSNEAVVESLLFDTNGETDDTSDTKEAGADMTSGRSVDRATTHTETLARRLSRKGSDRKAAQGGPQAASTGDTAPMLPGKKRR